MTSSAPQQLEGSQSPNSLEAFWDRNRGTVKTVFWVLALCLAGYYGWQYYDQKQKDAKWSSVSASLLLSDTYIPEELGRVPEQPNALLQRWMLAVQDASVAELDARMETALSVERPYLMWLKANALYRNGDYDQAKAEAEKILQEYPNHPLSTDSGFPVQFRPTKPVVDQDDEEETEARAQAVRDGDHDVLYQPPVAGSNVGRLLADIAKASAFAEPATWQKPEIPADAPRYKITLGDYGDVTIALMTAQAPKHCEVFEKLVADNHWDGIRVDEINRPAENSILVGWPGRQFHFGYASTKDQADRTKWDLTTPSEEECVVEDEYPGLSNFPGAVAASFGKENSEVDRIWICADDRSDQDDFRQVFAYVVDGMDIVEEVCGAEFEKSEDAQNGRGKPAENIIIESVTKVE